MITPLLEAALEYQKRGFSVIPCRPDKKPYVSWTEFQKRRAAKEEINQWWHKHPEAMIGIVTGEISGLFVVDCDTPEGYESVNALIPDSTTFPIVRTQRGGWHLYCLFPKDSNLTIGAGVMPGVDFRGEGGYVIAPPSRGEKGAYTWQEGLSLDEVEPVPVPGALLSALYNNINNSFKS